MGVVQLNQPVVSFEETFDAAPVGMLVVDERGAIVFVNRQLERLFGYDRSALLGRPVELLIDGVDGGRHQALRTQYLNAPVARPMGAGRDLYGRHADGRRIPVEIGLTPLQSGASHCVLASVVDLTERKRAEEQFRLSIEAAPNGMLLVDVRGSIVLVNAQIEAIFGYRRHELVGQRVDQLLPERFRRGHAANRDSFFRAPTSRPMGAGRELFGLRKDGREVPVEIGLSPLKTREGEFVLASIVDITERKQAREALQASLSEKEVLLKELHHRAKNNLQLIASLLELASESPSPGAIAQCRDRVQSIALVHEKLYQSGTFARIEVAEYVEALVEQMAQGWARPAVRVSVDIPNLFTLPLDAAIPCGLVINELVINAFKHAFPEDRAGSVVVHARRENARVTLEVRDDGVGFPEGEGRKPGHIGLELLHALARQLRGELRFLRDAGTCVRLSFEEVES